MKNVILSVAAVFVIGLASAQETENEGSKGFINGDTFISGSVGFSSEKSGDLKANTFKVMPQIGFFVTDNIAIGGMVGYSSTTAEGWTGSFDPVDPALYEEKSATLTVGAFGRYYTTPTTDFSFFGQLGAAYVSSTYENDFPGSSKSKSNGFGLELSPGVSYFISDHFALEATIGALRYNTVKPDFEGAESNDRFGLELNLSNIVFGLIYKF